MMTRTARTRLLLVLTGSMAVGCAVTGPIGLTPVSELTGRLELSGFSLLPPRGERWFVPAAAVVPVARDPLPLSGPAGLLAARMAGPVPRAVPIEAVTSGGVAFVKIADVKDPSHTTLALAQTVDAKGARNAAALQEQLEADVDREKASARFRLVRSGVSVDTSLGPTCVRYELVNEDHDVPGHPGSVFVTTTRAFRCLHPQWPKYAVDFGYSQRHRQGKPSIDVEAEVEPFLRSLRFRTDRPLLITRIPVGKSPNGVAVEEGSVWVTNFSDDTVSRIDVGTNRVVATIPVGKKPVGVAVADNAVWVANKEDGTVSRIDPRTNQVVAAIPVGSEPVRVAVGVGAVWVTNFAEGTVSRIDPRANRVVATIPVGRRPAGVAVGEGAVWVGNSRDESVSRIDPDSNRVISKPIPLGPALSVGWKPEDVAVGEGSVWVSTVLGLVVRIDPRTNQEVTRIPAGRSGVAVGGGTVWVTNLGTNTVSRIDPQTNRIVGKPMLVGGGPFGIAVGGGAVWIGNVGSGTVSRLDL